MALVTNPYANSTSPHSSYSDDGNTDDEEAAKVNESRLNECHKGTASLMLGSNKRLRASCEEQHLNNPGTNDSIGSSSRPQQAIGCPDDSAPNTDGARGDSFEGDECGDITGDAGDDSGDGGGAGATGEKLVPYASRPASSCSSGSCSSSSEIQQHLQSMFALLRPEETLKMAVKLESLRPGRTRYLVVVSRSVSSKRHSTCTLLLPAGSSGNLNSLSWPSATASLQSSRAGSVLSGPTVQPTARLGSVAPTDLGGALGVDTFVSSLEHCLLSSSSSSSSSSNSSTAAAAAAQQPSLSRLSAPVERLVPCGNDECDSKTNTRLSSDNISAAEADCTAAAGTIDDASALLDCTDVSNGVGPSSLGQQQQHNFQQSSYAGGNDVAGGSGGTGIAADGGKEIEESCLLGIDCNERTTVGLVLKVLADTSIRLDGDGGFSVSSCGKQHIFKPVSVQAMWSALQTLHKFSSKAREHNFFAGGPSHDWVTYYETHIDSDRSCLNEWNAMDSLESRRPPSPGSIRSKPTKREETESVIRSKLKEVMMSVDLDDVTSKFIRGRLEELLDMDLGEYKPFIDGEMLVILGQMDAPTEIFDHVYLGSEWNASNLEELQRNGVRHILNVTREIDNFFPGLFNYFNVRVYDDEKTDLLRHWDNTFKYISRAKMEGSKVLVHCKMGISRSASVVIAYAMKANNWDFQQALRHVKEKRNCIKPNKNFLMQLETYQGMLDAMKNKEKLQRSKSETNLKLAGAKEGRSLPGSEPTPLIQALSGATGGGQGTAGAKRHTIGGVAGAQLPHKQDAAGGSSALSGPTKTADDLDELDGGAEAHESPLALAADSDRVETSQDMRGRSRTRQHKHPHQQHQPKEEPLQHDHQQQQQQQQHQQQQLQQRHQEPNPNRQHTARPSFSESWQGILSHSGAWPEGNHRARPQTCAGGAASSSSPSTRAMKRHKSLSPDTHPRWVSSHEAAMLAASLGLPEPAEPVALVDRGASEPRASRRKQQSYSLEHLHGLLEMRSPCAETKTIRMPCGNGQNYSVSPNQIVHLQDKLPKASGRDVSGASSLSSSSSGAARTGSFLRRIIPSHYDTFVSSAAVAAGEATTSGMVTGGSLASASSSLTQCSTAASSTTTSTLTTVPSASSSAPPPTTSASPSASAAAQLPSLSSVKTIVCELESSSSSSSSSSNRIGHIPVAPPPSADGGMVNAAAPSAAIPIASIAAEAAAVAAASANRDAFRKEHGSYSSSSSSPSHHEPPICWTSSAQIIQQTSTTAMSSYAVPERQVHATGKQAAEEPNKRDVEEERVAARDVEKEQGSSAGHRGEDESFGDAVAEVQYNHNERAASSPVLVGEQDAVTLTNQEQQQQLEQGSGEPTESSFVHSSAPSRPRSSGTVESSGDLLALNKPTNDEPQPVRGSSVGVQRRTGVTDGGSFCLADKTEDIPWHPGTVRRTKEKIEERSSQKASVVGGGHVTPSLKRTGSSCSTELAADTPTVNVYVKVSSTAAATSSGGSGSCKAAFAGEAREPTRVPSSPTQESHPTNQTILPEAAVDGGGQLQHSSSSLHRGRRGMVSTNYARLSASAPDSYNMYAGPGVARATEAAGPRPTAAADTPATSQTAADGTMQQLVRFRTSIHGRASISVGGGGGAEHRQHSGDQQSEQAGDTLNQAGKVRNLKMSFEAKSHDRRREQKKVRSLPSSPVAVHAQMTGQPRAKPQSQVQEQQQPVGPPSKAAALVRQPSASSQSSQAASSPLEDVTVRDLVDRYEVHGPRARTSSNGGTSISTSAITTTVAAAPTVSRQRPRSVFEPLKSATAGAQSQPSSSSGLLFHTGKTIPHLLSHATAPFRLEEFSRPPVPPAAPVVRGLVNPPIAAVDATSTHLLNLNNNGAASYNQPNARPGAPTATNNNARNNNSSSGSMSSDAAVGDGSSRKRAQQHGRTHPLAKISPSTNANKHQQQQQQQCHHHHHHHHRHQYGGIGGQLQQHRLATGLVAPAQTAAVSGGAPTGTTAAANVYNTM